jgi:hypothetical protein
MLKRLCAILRCVVLTVAVYARIEAMKTANIQRAIAGESPAYNEEHFGDEAEYLHIIAAELKKAM